MTRVPSVVSGDNADLLATVGPLFIGDRPTLDLTYGRGLWWKRWRPEYLTTNDGDTRRPADYHEDWRERTAIPTGWACVVFDPPYVSVGGRTTSTLSRNRKHDESMQGVYAMLTTEKSPEAQHRLVVAPGIIEAARLLNVGGRLVAKVQDYVTGGRMRMASHWMVAAAEAAGLAVWDYAVHDSGLGPQPLTNRNGTPRVQQHTHRAHSYLYVFTKIRRAPAPWDKP